MDNQNNIADTMSIKNILFLALLLTVIAAVPRLYNLGGPGFYMDEETTAFASRSMAETGTPQMPSGMPYYRSLPHTWLNAMSAKTFGLDEEFSYRLPSALLGILTIPLIFLFARSFVGTPIAFLAALLLAFSEWHIITSRQARMYAPLLFFYVAFTFSTMRWAKRDTLINAAISITLFIITVSIHRLGVFAAFIPLITLFIKGYASTPQYKLILFSLIGGIAAYFAGSIIVGGAFQEWRDTYGIVTADTGDSGSLLQYFSLTGLQIAQGATGLLLGVWLAIKSAFVDEDNASEFRVLSRYSLAILFGVLAASGHLHGAFLSLLMLMILYPNSIGSYLQQAWKPVLAIGIVATITATLTITQSGVVQGVKSLLSFPYPNWLTLNTISTGITLLFISAMLYLALTKKTKHHADILVFLVISLLPLVVVGIFMKWAAARYMLQAYPFILIVSAYALYQPVQRFFQQRYANTQAPALIITSIVVLSGILGGHGLMSAYKTGTIKHGDKFNEAALIFPFYPDHKTPGEFVAEHRKDNDIVIAEDVLTQYWYAGKMDYWLRQYSELGGSFLYKGKDDDLHDIYVSSVTATPEILTAISNDRSRKVWLITSGETYYQRDLYLTKEQRQWLENIEANETPVFTGQDKITRVYCLHCESIK